MLNGSPEELPSILERRARLAACLWLPSFAGLLRKAPMSTSDESLDALS